MSMVALALRLSAVKALAGATLAGARVFDSAILPIDKLAAKEGPAPFIAVSTEDETGKPTGRDLQNGDRTIDLLIEIAIGQVIELHGEGGEGFAVADTDANLELSLAVMARQVDACLWGRGGGLWGDVFRAFAKSIEEAFSRRGVPSGENGERFAARQIAYRVKAFAEPAFDSMPAADTPFGKFLAALDAEAEADARYGEAASIIRQAIAGKPLGWPDVYTRAAVDGGLTEDEARKIGIAPIGGDPSAPIESATIEPDGWQIDQSAIDAALPPGESE